MVVVVVVVGGRVVVVAVVMVVDVVAGATVPGLVTASVAASAPELHAAAASASDMSRKRILTIRGLRLPASYFDGLGINL